MGMRSEARPRKPIWRLVILGALVLALLGGAGCGNSGGSGSSGTDLGFCDPGEIKLTDPSGAAGDEHGFSVDISGDWIVVGSPLDDGSAGFDSGSVRVYRCQSGVLISTQQLFASDGEAADRFGSSVAIDRDLIVVGAGLEDGPEQVIPPSTVDFGTNAGAAYVFRLDPATSMWVFEQKLVADKPGGVANDDDRRQDDIFGSSVAVDALTPSGPVIVVGALAGTRTIFRPDLDSRRGTAYVYRSAAPGSWSAEQKLDDPRLGDLDEFGRSVAIDGDRIVVGAQGDDVIGNSGEGAAYVFVLSGTWTTEQRLRATDAEAFDSFGWSVAIDEGAAGGPLIVVGAIGDDDDMGSAYVFRLVGPTWTQVQKLTASDGGAGDQFGYSVDSDRSDPAGPSIFVGARLNNEVADNAGAAYLFPFTGVGWAPGSKVTASDGGTCDNFGFSVALAGGRAVAGAPFQTDVVFCNTGSSPGAAYLDIP